MLDPSANRAEAGARKYQQPAASNAAPQASPPDHERAYPDEYSSYETRPTNYRERAGRYNPESYGPPNLYSPVQANSRWNHSTYSKQEVPIPIPIPVSSRAASRSNMLDEYGRPQSHISDVTGSGWGTDGRKSQHDSLSSPHPPPVHEYRLQRSSSAAALPASPDYASFPAIKVPRHTRELSNEDILMREAMRTAQSSKRIVSEGQNGYRKLLWSQYSFFCLSVPRQHLTYIVTVELQIIRKPPRHYLRSRLSGIRFRMAMSHLVP